jgi:CheY-like chemotaxis protein
MAASRYREPYRILVADDDEIFRSALVSLLMSRGYSVESVADSEAAMAALEAGDFDLVISDIMMPGNTELDLTRYIQEHHPNLQVILLTGHPTVSTAVDAVQLTVVAYLTKPVIEGEFFPLVEKACQKAEANRGLSDSEQRLSGWLVDLEHIHAIVRQRDTGLDQDAARELLGLSLGNIAGVLMDMKSLFDLALNSKKAPDVCGLALCSRHERLTQSLTEAVQVLERTKSNFKSKELAHLRQSLEAVLAEETQNPVLPGETDPG